MVSEKVVVAQQVEGTNRLDIASKDLQSRIRELAKLAKEQGYVTFDDLNDVLPEGLTNADDLDTILSQLRRMEIAQPADMDGRSLLESLLICATPGEPGMPLPGK